MIWFQTAFDPGTKNPWVVLRVDFSLITGASFTEVSRWPTRHEAEGHAKNNWEKLGR